MKEGSMILRCPALVLVPAATVLAAGCFNPKFKDHIACDLNGACPSGLTCSAQDTCEAMEGMAAPLDSGVNPSIDARPNAPGCFGTDPFVICLAALPTAPLSISLTTKIDTTNSPMCVATTSSSSADYCVVAATTIAITGRLRAIGSKPLVLLATDSITVSTANGLIDIGNHRGDTDLGAGADPVTCLPGTAPGGRSGGAGGSFTGTGGRGGAPAGLVTGGGQAAPGNTSITTLRGGCAGQAGDGGGPGGRGGGAVYLLAGSKIELATSAIPNTGINAAGEGGSQGVSGAVSVAGGGAGGGSGGMILFDAPTITCSGLILASGGGGGEGNGATSKGNPGEDPTSLDPAAGGSGDPGGGNGGAGSSAVAAGNGTNGSTGQFDALGDGGSGGGGGGGAGLIKAPSGANLGTQVSPPATS